MLYGDEYCAYMDKGFDPDFASRSELAELFQDARCITRFHGSPDDSFIQDVDETGFGGSLCYKVDEDSLIEINDSFLRSPMVISNEVGDLLSFQFVSSLKRSEYLGETKNVHSLGPAIIVSAVPEPEVTYRVPKIHEPIRHVVVYTTLSNVMDRAGEDPGDYPAWLQDILAGRHAAPRQRVLFLEDVHRELIRPFFHLPVKGRLLKNWMHAKYLELLSIGLQILKDDRRQFLSAGAEEAVPRGHIIRRARTLLDREYADPPSLPELSRHLGISETQLKSGFKSMHGSTVRQYVIERRIEAARLLLDENSHSISEIGDIVGYQDHSAFSRAFRRLSGCSPRAWRQSRRP